MNGPLIVQSDRLILLEVAHPNFEKARDFLSRFAELVKSPEHLHTYRLSSISLWNAASAGVDFNLIIKGLDDFAKYPVPEAIKIEIREFMSRYGQVQLLDFNETAFLLQFKNLHHYLRVARTKKLKNLILQDLGDCKLLIPFLRRGDIKLELIHMGLPVEDLSSFTPGEYLEIALRDGEARNGENFNIRDYQIGAVDAFLGGGKPGGGAGVIVLPYGAGKTIVGIGAICKLEMHTLILTTSTTAVHQWIDELSDKTSLEPEEVGEYTGYRKEIKNVTVSTYQMLTHRKAKVDDFIHLNRLSEYPWGLVIFDEVHLLPAPVFRFTSEIQAKRRLGLTATFIREDQKETDVFSLIGPKKYDIPWKELEKKGWIAKASCTEVKIPFPKDQEVDYALASGKDQFRMASENTSKLDVIEDLLEIFKKEKTLIIGHYIDQLESIAEKLESPLITGKTSIGKRDEIYEQFRQGEINTLVVSKVANFAIDLPEANVLIQVSGTFGSRQEEAQRLGRVLRPKKLGREAKFFTLTSTDTCEEEFSHKRQLFLAEQGYSYEIVSLGDGDQLDQLISGF